MMTLIPTSVPFPFNIVKTAPQCVFLSHFLLPLSGFPSYIENFYIGFNEKIDSYKSCSRHICPGGQSTANIFLKINDAKHTVKFVRQQSSPGRM